MCFFLRQILAAVFELMRGACIFVSAESREGTVSRFRGGGRGLLGLLIARGLFTGTGDQVGTWGLR